MPADYSSSTDSSDTVSPSDAPSRGAGGIWPKDDPFKHMEEALGEQALAWARERTKEARAALGAGRFFETTRERLLEAYQDPQRLTIARKRGEHAYNFWQDEKNPKGVIRRAAWTAWLDGAPEWETILDIDALAVVEGVSWVYKGVDALETASSGLPALLKLSDGGSDSLTVREMDLGTGQFRADGFRLDAEGKHGVSWMDENHVWLGLDLKGETVTTSGYPRQIRLWARGEKPEEASVRLEVPAESLSLSAGRSDDGTRHFMVHSIDFYSSEMHERVFSDGEEAFIRFDVPTDAETSVWNGWVLAYIQKEWAVSAKQGARLHKPGSLLAIRERDFWAGSRDFDILFEPSEGVALSGHFLLKNHIVLNVDHNVVGRVEWLRPPSEGVEAAEWARGVVQTPAFAHSVGLSIGREDAGDEFFVESSGELTPPSLGLVDLAGSAQSAPAPVRWTQKLADLFDASGLASAQRWATAKDGTRIPYFLIGRREAIESATPAPSPCVLYGYGGFQVALQPNYSAGVGRGWLAHGGLFAVANIRGGGEFGPEWHQAALKTKREVAFGDFEAVAEHLIASGLTTAAQLGIEGGSNGGLLVGSCMTRRPDLFRAVSCQVPLLDMENYSHLLAGASWMAEYGDPQDPVEGAYLASYSPYHQAKEGVEYPAVFFVSSTRDDRVHPAHARKMMAKMQAQGHPELFYVENEEGGHAAANEAHSRSLLDALTWSFFAQKLGLETEG